MISKAPTITDAGKNLLIRALGGEQITFTKFKIGNGELDTESSIAEMSELINPLLTFPITDVDDSSTGYVKVSGVFDSTVIPVDFRWRELGIFCKGEDDVEVLYAYANDGENAGMLKANATDVVTEQTVALIIAIGEAENVTAIIAESVLYAPKTEFDAHVQNTENPHSVTKEQVGLGDVPNVTTNDQTPTYEIASADAELESGERMQTAFSKIARAVRNIIAHISNRDNPHRVTLDQIDGAEREHTHSTGDIISGVLGLLRGGTGVTSYPALRNALGLGNTTGPLDVSKGGTGVTSLAALRELVNSDDIVIGEYTGNGQSTRSFNLGYQPKAVLVWCAAYPFYQQYCGLGFPGCNGVVAGYTQYLTTYNYHYVTVRVDANGFTVSSCGGGHSCTNINGYRYKYIIVK